MLEDKLGGNPKKSLDGTDYSLRRTNNPSLYSTKAALTAVGGLIVAGGLAYLAVKGYDAYFNFALTTIAVGGIIGFAFYYIPNKMNNEASFLSRR